MQGRTVILIAHRLSTVVNADMIAVVQNGKVTETGSHQILLETSQFYCNLFNMQNFKGDTEARFVLSVHVFCLTLETNPNNYIFTNFTASFIGGYNLNLNKRIRNLFKIQQPHLRLYL